MIYIDWPRVILNLRSAGMTGKEIAQAVGYSGESAVYRVLNDGVEPKFMTALRLLDLHLDRCPEQHGGICG